MKNHCFPFAMIALATIGFVMGAGPAKFDGEFVDKKFLNGQGVFDFSVHRSGSALEIAFDAAYSDGHGATPDATGAGKVNGNAAQFTWKDRHDYKSMQIDALLLSSERESRDKNVRRFRI